MPKRLFVGLELPESCQETLANLDPEIKGVRWIDSAQIHLTMSFLGTLSQSGEATAREALSQVRVPPFFLPIEGIGVFGGSHPTVVWAGVGKGHPHLYALHKHLQDALLAAGLEPDLRPFQPHITVARVKGVSGALLQPFLRKHAEAELGLWEVTGFALFSSVLMGESASYTVEMRREF
ncbi:MAG: 2-5 ligase [Chthoniobacteraceae bacterium]|nr:2-5 ligase [Chthoniobacteraceae bacterium]